MSTPSVRGPSRSSTSRSRARRRPVRRIRAGGVAVRQSTVTCAPRTATAIALAGLALLLAGCSFGSCTGRSPRRSPRARLVGSPHGQLPDCGAHRSRRGPVRRLARKVASPWVCRSLASSRPRPGAYLPSRLPTSSTPHGGTRERQVQRARTLRADHDPLPAAGRSAVRLSCVASPYDPRRSAARTRHG
jgi:hypothetical protein